MLLHATNTSLAFQDLLPSGVSGDTKCQADIPCILRVNVMSSVAPDLRNMFFSMCPLAVQVTVLLAKGNNDFRIVKC